MRLAIALSFIFLFSNPCAFGQIKQTARFELALKTNNEEITVYSLEKEGLMVVEESTDFDERKRIRKFIQLDSALNIIWATQAAIPEEEVLVGYEYTAGLFQLLYTHGQHENLRGSIVHLDLENRTIIADPFDVQLNMKLTHFTVAGKNSIIGGQVGLQPMIALFDHETKRIKILPGFFLNDSDLIDLRANRNETFSIIQLQRKGREKTMTYRAFDSNGNQLVEDRFMLEPEMTIQSAMSSTLVHNEVMVAGIYSYGNSKLSNGIFSVILNPSGEKKITYTDFTMMERFLDYLPEKKSKRIIEKASQRRKFGRVPDFRIASTLHRIDEHPFGFLIFGESFQIPNEAQNYMMANPGLYRPGFNNYYYPFYSTPWRYGYDPFNSTARLQSDIRMTNAYALAFDLNGQYLWDASVDLGQISISPGVQFADYCSDSRGIEFLFPQEKGLGYSIQNSESPKKSVSNQPLEIGAGTILSYESSLNHTIRRWYGNTLFIYGLQQIRVNKQALDEQKKRIFFINKISLIR